VKPLDKKKRTIVIVVASLVGVLVLLYAAGVVGQLLYNYDDWLAHDGFAGTYTIRKTDWNPLYCIAFAVSPYGFKALLGILIVGGIVFAIYKLYNRFGSKSRDPRGFKKKDDGLYGTASMMEDKELKSVLDMKTIEHTDGVILGEKDGKIVSMPKDTLLNRHIAVFGASGTMKSRAIIRNALFQALKNNESVVITDPKGELYGDMSQLYKDNGYTVKVFNLVNPEHSDSWNCMADLNGSTLMAQVLTNIIIGNTKEGKGDHFWDNGEANLLKALILLIDAYTGNEPEYKNLASVYKQLTKLGVSDIISRMELLPDEHPAKAPFQLFMQSSETVRSSMVLGLGTRLQVLQNQEISRLVSRSDIDLTLPGREKCAYFIIISDSDNTMAFLSSLFFSCLFMKLRDYADAQYNKKCAVPVNFILDEFNNIGRLGGAEDGSDFCRTLSTCRSRDIRVMMAVQSLGQLQNRYPNNLWAELVGNCDVQLMLGCTDELTSEYFSNRSGEMTIEVNNVMTNRKTIAIAQLIPEYRQMDGVGRRQVLTPDEVLRVPRNQLLCVVRGCNILFLDKVDYTRHPYYERIRQISINDYYPKPKEEVVEIPLEKPKEQKSGFTVSRGKPKQINNEDI